MSQANNHPAAGGSLSVSSHAGSWLSRPTSRRDRERQSASSPEALDLRVTRPTSEPALDWQQVERQVWSWVHSGLAWYQQTPPADRVCWGGLIACSGLGLGVFLGKRIVRLRRRRIIPAHFTACFLDRLHEGKLDGGKCPRLLRRTPSPAARIALAAVRRWGGPAIDLERAVALAHKVESELLRRNVGTLRRIAARPRCWVSWLHLRASAGFWQCCLGRTVHSPEAEPSLRPCRGGPRLRKPSTRLPRALPWPRSHWWLTTLCSAGSSSSAVTRSPGAETIDAIAMTTTPRAPALLSPSIHPLDRPLVSSGAVATWPCSVHLVRESG